MPALPLQQTAAELAAPGLGFDLLRSALALLGVCGLIWLSLRWLSRRGLARPQTASLHVVERLPLEPRNSLYLVRAAGRLLLIGVGDGSAPRLIARLDDAANEKQPERAAVPREAGSDD